MKNFYEATVIKSKLTCGLKLTLTPIGSVNCVAQIGSKILYEKILTDTQTFILDWPLTDPIELSIQINRNHPDALMISLDIDNKEILPKYQHLANPPTDYLDFNSVWVLKIPNFYPWYHEITGQGWII